MKQIVLNRQSLLVKEKMEIVLVDLGNEEAVYVRQMTGRERDIFEQSLIKETKDEKGAVTGYERSITDYRAKLAVMTICDEKGVLILKPEDYETLSQNMSAKRLENIVNVAQGLSKITEKDKEMLTKNSVPEVADNSNSASVAS